jgi:signal transduction histidine kinase
MNPLRSVGARLSLALVLVVAGALGAVYVIVVPSLQRNLVHAKFAELRREAPPVAQRAPVDDPIRIDNYVQQAAASTNTRVIVFQFLTLTSNGPSVRVSSDSNAFDFEDVQEDRVAEQALLTLAPAEGVLTSDGRKYAEVARPARRDAAYVVALRAPLRDALGNVHLVRRRLVEAGFLALLASLAVGYGAASVFARRLRRLEQAAERIAAGDFGEPVVDHGGDEVGELARAFERMRGRLAQLDHARREFIANASHELRTPIFSLGGFLELLDEEELDEATRRDFLTTMREQVERLTKLATELLDLSRLDAGRLRIELQPVDLADVATAVVDEFRGVALAREHELEVETEGAPTVLGDTERVLQIARILVENALVHTPPGTRVLVRARAGDRPKLRVEDDGPGIPPEHAAQVFERFYRVEGAMASGSGLGLAIARELAALMHGVVELETQPGATAFALLLPPADDAARTGEPRLHVETALR